MIRIYLDNCCYNRPFDDQSSICIRLESDAKLYIQELVRDKKLELIWSFVLDYENSVNPYPEKRERIQVWRNLSVLHCTFLEQVADNAKILMNSGLKQVDAAHIALRLMPKLIIS
ncbi:MAG: hypothetical protein ACRC2T_08430 [Thermoguttaceae bacterium]